MNDEPHKHVDPQTRDKAVMDVTAKRQPEKPIADKGPAVRDDRKKTDKDDRLKAALKANLARRKAQARARQDN